MKTFEVNFDGLVGPTHNYAGLAYGNVASIIHARLVSNPKAAALQGLKKMKRLHDLGVKQAVLPPQERPNLPLLRSLGFSGTDADVLQKSFDQSIDLFLAAFSSSSMWTANAATVCPSTDSMDRRLHFTISNLTTHLHRAQEAPFTYSLFKKIFYDPKYFTVHPPLFPSKSLGDEGAANHNRFAMQHSDPGVQLFVYGHSGFRPEKTEHVRYPARQTLEASQSIIRLHQLHPEKTLITKQNTAAINAGVFHNDVISVANENVFIYHEKSFEDTEQVIQEIKDKIDFPMFFIKVLEKELSLEEAVQSYLFNSQVITLPSKELLSKEQLSSKEMLSKELPSKEMLSKEMILIAPEECKEIPRAQSVIERILQEDNPIKTVEYVDCRQSMQNGGGPACLRLRIVLNEEEIQHCHPGLFLNEALFQKLENWINKHYRDHLTLDDMKDPVLLHESRVALDELSKILGLYAIY